MAFGQGDEFGLIAKFRLAHQGIDANRVVLALDLDQVELDVGVIARPLIGVLADHDIHAVSLRLAFEPRGKIHVIAED